MLLNNNLKICRRLVGRDFYFHRIKNLILIVAAALVMGLYSFLFLLGNSVEDAFLLNYQYTYGSTSHILYTGLTEEEADLLAQNSSIKSSVRISTVGQLSDPLLGQRSVKLAVTDRDYARTVLSVPETGNLPQGQGQIAMDEFTMDSLGILHEIGAPVTLQWTDANGQEHTSEFTLCGWWASPTNFSEACAWISADTAKTLMPDYDSSVSPNITLGVTLYQPKDLESQAARILSEQGLFEASYTTNLAYNQARMEQASGQARPFYEPAVLVIICGFLMIYGIVHVTGEKDDGFFAGLKALGMTPRQLRYFLGAKAFCVTLSGLIPGAVIGFLIHLAVTSRVVIGLDENPAIYFLSWQPFALAGIFTAATVILAYLLPLLKMSGKLPMQLMRESGKRFLKKSHRTDGRVSILRLAVRTLGRGLPRTLITVCVMLLSVLMLCSVWTQYVSIKEEIYMEAMSPWDYSITDGSAYLSVQQYNQDNLAITDETVMEIARRPEVTSVSALKSHEVTLKASPELSKRLSDYYNEAEPGSDISRREEMAGYPDWQDGLSRLEKTGEYIGIIVSLERDYLEHFLEENVFTSGAYDEDAFESGDYVLAAGANARGISSPAAGESITLEGREFTVLGSTTLASTLLSGGNSHEAAFCLYYFVPPKVFDAMFPGQGIRQMAVNIDHSCQDSFESYLDEYAQGMYRGIEITRRSEYQENFVSARLNTVLASLIVGGVFSAIALVNFMNLLAAKTISRKQEFAVYESLGMSRSQLKQMVLLEGILYAALMAVIILPVSTLFEYFIMPGIIENMGSWVMVYTFTLIPVALLLPLIAVVSVAVPILCLRFITRGSIIQRLHVIE
ncbi:MAG TPA: ABC transporter permease [Candidatus Scybalocola faecavium]|nr:ABC transporter permease [Candidatus Scybalocola faecavium]